MDTYVTGNVIKELREKRKLTQGQLADKIGVSDKTISKWETQRGLPDITLLEPLASALSVSVTELFAGKYVTNKNKASNMTHLKFYVCPVCGNIITATGESVISCCGIQLPALEAEKCNEEHEIMVEKIEGEYYVTVSHEMTKQHYISFIAFVTSDKINLIKLYPEQNAECRFARSHGMIYVYCNKHGLMQARI